MGKISLANGEYRDETPEEEAERLALCQQTEEQTQPPPEPPPEEGTT